MKNVIASLVLGLVASVSFAASPIAPAAPTPAEKVVAVKKEVKPEVKKEVAKKVHKTHKAAKKVATPSAPVTK